MLGILGIWIGCRRSDVRFLDFLDAAAPGVAVAQAIGRFGNYFNNELYGAATNLPWGLEIHCFDQAAGAAVTCLDSATNVMGTFQPTFLYESLWCLLLALVLVRADRRFSLARARSPRSTACSTPLAGASSRWCGSTMPTTSSGFASTCGHR